MLLYWVAANMVDGVGPVTIKKLLDQHQSIEKVCSVINAPLEKADLVIQTAKDKNISIVCFEDAEYPERLKHIYDPPAVLFTRGRPLLKEEKAIAIVGTRSASHYGLELARKFAFELASLGFTIVSGLATGIDTSAHQGALEAKGKTIAVFGCGVDVIFPAENRPLAEDITRQGTLVSEYPIGSGTAKGNFPRRNRIISGLSLGVIVVEGHYDSGAMITAKCALDQGREVFAIPGQIGIDQSKGPHWLIKQGAKLVETIDDVLEELNIEIHSKMTNDKLKMSNEGVPAARHLNLSNEEKKIVGTLSLEPKHIDNIACETGMPIAQVSSLLMMLEMKKAVKQLAGKRYIIFA
ncbi:MAG: DNA-processing protein DprA [Candidatus Margulisbacteria bacterium]|nr:DNA-processing protein DprA [Candidatus Margulisiibacteriota bacterium]